MVTSMESLPPPTFDEFITNMDPNLRDAIEIGFEIRDVIFTPRYAQFVVQPRHSDINRSLLAVKAELESSGRIPFIQKKGDLLVLFIGMLRPREFSEDPIYARDPEKAFMPSKRKRSLVQPILLVATIIATLFAGYTNSLSIIGIKEFVFSWRALGLAGLFSISVMSILGFHELGHYITSRRSGIDATLPYFIPAIPPIGTFGAFIQIKSPIFDRNTLLRLGFSGPIISFVLAVVTLMIGISLSEVQEEIVDGEGGMLLGSSILFERLVVWIKEPYSEGMVLYLHPVAFAGWVGLLVTSINLMPIGQLDGGHISRAILGHDWAKRVSLVSIGALIVMGLMLEYEGWLFWAFLAYMLGGRGASPLNDVTRVDSKHLGLGIIAVFVFILSFIPQPFSIM